MAKLTHPYLVAVITESEVDHYSKQGFQLHSVIYTDVVRTWKEERSTQDPQTAYRATEEFTKGAVATEPRFVMHKDEESAIADLTQRLQWTLNLLEERRAEVAKFDLERRALQDKLVATTMSRDAAHRNYETSQDRNRKLEQDLAKVRAAVGEFRMKEILGGTP